ncbi:dihydroorotase [Alterisphingorhabdus coralli]|uniref:Dihydroorotase n=1 Tax=Alterisphingorhabdus coralli TaxID=3071408 RepID=A0AA97FAY3_9SPHN|nr:dihydroorotase [Parasphingorhabdus sp. SCSIO 66989]WOE76433.1 dihydroorotase [Parasphingorhabdus sp. SCSIO 66989]
MSNSTSITNGRLILPDGSISENGSLSMAGDEISAINPDTAPSDALDAKGQYVAPGIIDLGVFAVDKPAFHFGGITRAAVMPDQNPPLDHPARVRFVAQSGKPDFWVHPLGGATRELAGSEMAELALMQDAGARGVATGRGWIADSGTMLRLMQYCAALDLPLFVHSEDEGLTGKAVATDGEMALRLGLPSAPAEAEAISIARDIALVRLSGAHLHFRQVTTRAGLDLIRAAKAEGLSVTCGITPAHFMLSDVALGGFRTFTRLSPPLRSEDDRQACLEALADGTIDVIASGHDPRGPEDKRLPFADAEPGMAGAETLLALTLNLVRDKVLSLSDAIAKLTSNPAAILSVDAGQLAEGMEADIMVFDMDRPWVVDSAKMEAAAGNTPFDKMPVQGRVTALFKGGRQIAL